MAFVAQLDPAGGTLVAYVGTFLIFALGYSVTAHIAARYVLGEVSARRALLVGPVPAAASVLLQQYGPAITIGVTMFGDYLAIRSAYRLNYRLAGLVAVIHYTVTVIAGITLVNLVGLLGTAPT
ncbi:hypothetical protein [Halostella sp. PRR32]|uniref:DUF7473 family protein n=1 Tax=Halostella sp. PRR32 TaxID=3098147 RepID=UPI00110F5040|nr:hypothetical protein [Halostella sp. PRR32]